MIKKIKEFLYRRLGLEGYLRFVQRGYFLAYNLGLLRGNETYAIHYFAKTLIKPGDVIIDLGANLGYFSILFAKWTGAKGKVFSVEPIEIYNRIFNEQARKYKNITLLPYALGLEEKPIELVTSPASDSLNTGLPHVYNPDTDGDLENQKFRFKAEMKIPSRLFADLERIDYIKCDIEGFEAVVLIDMKDIIARCRPIVQVEIWGENEETLRNMFQSLDYKAYKLADGKLALQTEIHSALPGDYIFMPNKN
jgi:FkbM family methyltransferase